MKLKYSNPSRPQDLFVVGGEVLKHGDEFEVDDDYGRYLLGAHSPLVAPADYQFGGVVPEPAPVVMQAGQTVAPVDEIPVTDGEAEGAAE